ncbi:MAG: hypothetical protein HC898_05065 [Phycisphaerales bacterium]|nr:hypothetical protein [Phycisphaerales bacterium]
MQYDILMKKTHVLSYGPELVHQRLQREELGILRFQGGDVSAWQKSLRRRLAVQMGYDIMPGKNKRVPLKVRTLWHHADMPWAAGLGSVTKIVFTAEQGADVPAYVCLPHNVKPPYRWMICLQGHSSGMHNSLGILAKEDPTIINPSPNVKQVEGDRDFALGCLKRGFAALCIEQRNFGERLFQARWEEWSKRVCLQPAMHSMMLGRTLAAERVFDVDRALDYLWTRKDVDRANVGVMGNSGGGTTSIYAGALLPRVAFMMPSCSFCTYRGSIMSIYHCPDNYIPGLLRWAESADIVGLFAPKPVVVVAGNKDDIFPIQHVRKAYADLRKIYRAAGAEKQCQLVVGDGGHRFYADDAWPVLTKMIK